MLTIDRDSLKKTIRDEDLVASSGSVPITKDLLLEQCLEVCASRFSSLTVRCFPLRKKSVYNLGAISEAVVLRRLNQVVRISCRIRPADRDLIVRQLSTVLREGVPHRVYKFDIESFFESVDTGALIERLLQDKRISRAVSTLIGDFLNRIRQLGVVGLPRGIALSATLAEYTLQYFDDYISMDPRIYYCARYVDDIILLTSGLEQQRIFSRTIENFLPSPLKFNNLKTRTLPISVQRSGDGRAIIGSFDYLGYNFRIHESKRAGGHLLRDVDIGIAQKKVQRLKTKVACAIVDFLRTGDINQFQRRLMLLTGNYNIRDNLTGRNRNVGIFCNYRRCNDLDALAELDDFLRASIIGSKSRLAKRMSRNVNSSTRRSMLRISFHKGFSEKIFYNFSPTEVSILSACWSNV